MLPFNESISNESITGVDTLLFFSPSTTIGFPFKSYNDKPILKNSSLNKIRCFSSIKNSTRLYYTFLLKQNNSLKHQYFQFEIILI